MNVFARQHVFSRSRLDGESTSIATLAAVVVFCVAVLTHYEVLTYWFTGGDTLTLIEKSRMRTVEEAWTVLSSPLMYGTNFSIVVALFYRPVANLSYAIDYAVWGLDPFGYHLTDLLLHAVTAVLTFEFVRRVGRDTLVGALAGCLFAVHPITAEVVPTPARRHDVLATLFVLGSLLLFVRAIRRTDGDRDERGRNEGKRDDDGRFDGYPRARRWLLIVGSVLLYLLAVGAKEVGVIAPPLIGAWFLLVAYDREYSVGETLWRGTKVALPYTVVTFAYLRWRLQVLGGLGGYKSGPWKTSEPLLDVVSKYVLSLLYPVDIAGWLWGYDVRLVPGGFYVFLVGALALLAYVLSGTDRYEELLRSDRGRLVAVSFVWLVVLGAVFVRFGRYSLRSGYVALVPTAALLALLLVTTGRRLLRGVSRIGTGDRRRIDFRTAGVFCLVAVIVLSLVWVSPLVYPYDDWERAGDVASEALPAAANAYEGSDAPPRAVIAIAGIPRRPGSPGVAARRPETRTIAFFYANTVASWIRLTRPDSEVATYVGGRLVPVGEGPVDVNATITRTVDRSHYRLLFRYPPANGTKGTERPPSAFVGDGKTPGTVGSEETSQMIPRTKPSPMRISTVPERAGKYSA